jgi:1-phosphofructokinase family hexose kinase
MILAVNVHAALDRVFFIDHFEPETHMRPSKTIECVGGKGLDVAVALKTLGASLKAITFIAGKNGTALAELLDQKGIETELLWVPGETRLSNVIVETRLCRHSHITTTGYRVNRQQCDQFLAKIERLAPNMDWAVLSGSLPPGAPAGFYREIVTLLHQHGVRVLVDCLDAPLLETLVVSPEIVKMNASEFRATFHKNAHEIEKLVEACRETAATYAIRSLVITCGKAGMLAFTPQGDYHAGCPEIEEINAAGAGDAASAAIVHRLALGEGWPQALAWAAAASGAVVKTEGTAECELDEILNLIPQVWVKEI